jgi:hypothetical protein
VTDNAASGQRRECAYCGLSLAHEGGIRAWGALYCSEECADAHEDEAHRGTYAEDPLGGSWS